MVREWSPLTLAGLPFEVGRGSPVGTAFPDDGLQAVASPISSSSRIFAVAVLGYVAWNAQRLL